MKKALLSCLVCLSLYAQEVQLVHDFTTRDHPEEIFDPASPYRILQDALYKNHIQLRCLNKQSSPLYAVKEEKSTWKKKIQDFFMEEEKTLCISDDPRAYLVLWNLPSDVSFSEITKVPTDRLILFAFEPPVNIPKQYSEAVTKQFSKIYTWNDDLVDDKKFFKFFYPALKQLNEPLPEYKERKLCTLIAPNASSNEPGELFSARRSIISYFESSAPNDFALYGTGWKASEHKCYKGVSAEDTLKQYRFTICYEDMKDIKGYISEKIFECFSAGSVPVYLGASNITKYIPKHCFIDRRDFKSDEELYLFLKNVSEESYDMYVNNIRTFIDSKEAKVFSMDCFIETFTEAIQN
jgi:hypothetical protein